MERIPYTILLTCVAIIMIILTAALRVMHGEAPPGMVWLSIIGVIYLPIGVGTIINEIRKTGLRN